MGRARSGRQLMGLLFLFLGCVWLLTIYQRCRIIAPQDQLLPAGGIREVFSAGGDPGQPFLPPVPRARSWQTVGFWMVAVLELICAFLYGVAGIALLRGYPSGRVLGLAALGGDALYKIFVAGYYFGCAIPLARTLAHHRNVFVEYYLPDGHRVSAAGLLSGLAGYYPRIHPLLMAGYLVLLGGAAWLLWWDQGGLARTKRDF